MVRDRPDSIASGKALESLSLEDLDEMDLLLTELKISQGRGNLILCTVASVAYREKVIQAIRTRFTSRTINVDDGYRLISDLRSLREKEQETLIWILPEKLNKDILDALNNFRELFYEADVPSLIFMTPAALDEIIWQAPDFWRYRGGLHRLKGQDHGMAFQAIEALSTPFNFSYQSKEELLRRKSINEYLLEKINDSVERESILSELGTIHFLLAETCKAIDYYNQALVIAREIEDRQREGDELGNLGSAYYELGEMRKAIEYHDQALIISRETGDKWGEGDHLGNLGNAYSDLGETHKAIEYYEQALTIFREIGDKWGEGDYLGNLGNAYFVLDETQKAIEYYEQALAILRQIRDRRGEGDHLGNLGSAYSELGETHKAIEYYERALAIAREIGDRRGEESHMGNLGLTYYRLGETRKAIDYYEQSLAIAREIGDKRGEGLHLVNLGLALDELGRRNEAIRYTEEALKIFNRIESLNAEHTRQQLAKLQAEATR